MKDLTLNTPVNSIALDREIRAAFPGQLVGVSFDGTQYVLHLEDNADQAEILKLVAQHDPTQETDEQARDRQGQDAEEAVRQQIAGWIDWHQSHKVAAGADVRDVIEHVQQEWVTLLSMIRRDLMA